MVSFDVFLIFSILNLKASKRGYLQTKSTKLPSTFYS